MAVFSLDLLLPALDEFNLDKLDIKAHLINITLTSTRSIALCPLCGDPSRQIHSRYQRQVQDLPWNAIQILLLLNLKRFFCINQNCKRKIFVERLHPTITAYARRTSRLLQKLTELAFELGGQAGTSICEKLGMSTSASSLLRYINRTPLPPEGFIKMVGVDDWAIRKGQTYGTIVVDLQRHRPVALLQDRTKETFVAWLEKHPEVEIISRDRATAYSQAADLAAPQALQVADKFHLLQNLAQAVQRVFERNAKELGVVVRRIAELEKAGITSLDAYTSIGPLVQQVDSVQGEVGDELSIAEAQIEAEPPRIVPMDIPELTTDAELSQNKNSEDRDEDNERQLHFEQVKALHQQGYSQRAIAAHLGIHRQTVKNYIVAEQLPKRGSRSPMASSVAPYLGYLRKRWEAGFYNKRQLWLEIQKQGFTGTVNCVHRALAKFPAPEGAAVSNFDRTNLTPLPKLELRLRPISARQATWLLLHKDEKLKSPDKLRRQILLELCPVALSVRELAQSFKQMLRERKVEELDKWLLVAEQSGIGEFERFATGLRRDYKAVRAGVELEISNGQTEGQVNRLKWLKRAMFGRAKFHLLSRRVLYNRAG